MNPMFSKLTCIVVKGCVQKLNAATMNFQFVFTLAPPLAKSDTTAVNKWALAG